MTQESNLYKRVVIDGTLTCLSDLHVGDGDLALHSERFDKIGKTGNTVRKPARILKIIALTGKYKQAEKKQPDKTEEKVEKKEGTYNSVCIDYEKRAYIPASSLRGSLAAVLCPGTPFADTMFGFARHNSEDMPGTRQAGKLRVHDARIARQSQPGGQTEKVLGFSKERHTFLRHGVSIDPLTGTAIQGKLFCYELVPEQTVFQVRFEADDVTEEELTQLLALFEVWNTRRTAALGSGTSKGFGRVRWQLDAVNVLTPEEEISWLESESLEPPRLRPITMEPADLSSIAVTPDRSNLEFTLILTPKGPFLINEPGYVTGKELEPNLEFSRKGNKALVPARSLAGLIRGRASRILSTIAHLHFGKQPEQTEAYIQPLLDDLFGSEKKQSALWFTDALGEAEEHVQYFIGIDRFTGGVNKGDNYTVRAADCEQLTTGTCIINMQMTPNGDWWKGLLLLVLRDAMEGDLAIGWGKAKGYGKMTFHVRYQEVVCTDWQSLIENLDMILAVGWVESLHNKIETMIQQQ